jgi:hypothetical protein
MTKALLLSISLVTSIGCISLSDFAFATEQDVREKLSRPTLSRSPSEEELLQLQERREHLLKEQEFLLKKEERHCLIKNLKQEIQELEDSNLGLKSKLGLVRDDDKEKEAEEFSSFHLESTPSFAAVRNSSYQEKILEIIDKYEAVLANMVLNRQSLADEKFHYGLAKHCQTNIPTVREAMGIIQKEQSFQPDIELLKNHVEKYLLQPCENKKVYTDSIILENIKYGARFYVKNFEPSPISKSSLNIISLYPGNVEPWRQFDKNYKNKLSEVLEGHKVDQFYVRKNTVYFNYGFIEGQKSYAGFLLLTKPLDVHLYLK